MQTLNLQYTDFDTSKVKALKFVASRAPHTHGVPALVTATHGARGLDAWGRNNAGVIQRSCTLCGDCSSGCNVGAKNTLPMNYLPMAKRAGAELYTQTEVERIEKLDVGYRVHFAQHIETTAGTQICRGSVLSRIVILSAGSLGTSGILLRSQTNGFRFSDRLGYQWSGNGDTYGFIVGGDRITNTAGIGAYPTKGQPIGVAQQMHLYLQAKYLKQRMLIQEGSVPRAYANALGALVGDLDLDRTLPLFALGHDGASGRVTLRKGRPTIEWPESVKSGFREFAHNRLRLLAKAANGRYRKPESLGRKSFTVHPLGGCAMSDSVQGGVTNDIGNVFDGHTGSQHPGLYIADGSLIPTSLAANPFLTISALSERVAEGILNQNGLFA